MEKKFFRGISLFIVLCLIFSCNFKIVNAAGDSNVIAVGETFSMQPVYKNANKSNIIEYLYGATPISIYTYESGFCYIGYRKDNEIKHGWIEQQYVRQFNIPFYKTIYLVNKANGCTVTAYENDPGNPLYCNSKIFQGWEQLQIIPGEDGYVALKFISTNKFASVRIDESNAPVHASANDFLEWEAIHISPVGDSDIYDEEWYTFKSLATGNYITSSPNEWANALVANQPYLSDYSKFRIDYTH